MTTEATVEAPRWGNRQHGGRDAYNLAACALVAAKVYEAFGWVRWDRRSEHGDPDGYHVPDAEALMAVLHELGGKALDAPEATFDRQVGVLRFLACSDDDGDDSSVDFYLSIGSADMREFRALRRRATAASPESGRFAEPGDA